MSVQLEAPAQLSAELVQFLQGPQLVLVTTIDADSKWPSNNLITWVYAKDRERVRLAADATGRVMENIRADHRVLLTVITNGACHTVEGTAHVLVDQVEGIDPKVGIAEVQVRTIRDVTFLGGQITAAPAYEVTYDKALKERLDASIFAAMKGL